MEVPVDTLRDKTLLITGASRGIGKAIALRAARDGARIAVAAKTDRPHPKLPGTVHAAVEQINAAGGRGLACVADIRYEDQVEAAIEKTVNRLGPIDILVNNASAIDLSGTLEVSMKRVDLMHAVNARGTFLMSKHCLPYLLQSDHAHILNIAPPLNMEPRWFAGHVAYTMAKYSMSMCVLGMAEEFRDRGVAVNALWPKTVIATAAVKNLLGGQRVMRHARKPEIMADAAHAILRRHDDRSTGQFFVDEEVLRGEGVIDFAKYAVTPGVELYPDFFL